MQIVLRLFFFFQAEDGIRDRTVTGVQTCALPIFGGRRALHAAPCEGHRGILRPMWASRFLDESMAEERYWLLRALLQSGVWSGNGESSRAATGVVGSAR